MSTNIREELLWSDPASASVDNMYTKELLCDPGHFVDGWQGETTIET